MASPTQQTRLRRKMKKAKAGSSRKKKNKTQGTTKSAKDLFKD